MLTPHEAIELILSHSTVLPVEDIPLGQAVGRVLSEDLFARQDLPAFTNSAMDGFAVRLQDLREASPQKPMSLAVRAVVRAGDKAIPHLSPGEAVKIMTGAPMPVGA